MKKIATAGAFALLATLPFSSLLVIPPLREYFWILLGLPAAVAVAGGLVGASLGSTADTFLGRLWSFLGLATLFAGML